MTIRFSGTADERMARLDRAGYRCDANERQCVRVARYELDLYPAENGQPTPGADMVTVKTCSLGAHRWGYADNREGKWILADSRELPKRQVSDAEREKSRQNSRIAVVIKPGQPGRTRRIAVDLTSLQSQVGGYLEAVSGTDWHLYCDEDGLAKGLPVNAGATVIARTLLPGFAGVIHGTVIILGTDSRGDESHVPQRIIDLVRALGSED